MNLKYYLIIIKTTFIKNVIHKHTEKLKKKGLDKCGRKKERKEKRERERERERECVCVCVKEREREREMV